MLGDRELTFEQYIAIVKRRFWWIIIPTICAPGLVYLYSLRIPNQYTSQTLVLVEQQKVPDNFVKPVITEELNQRLATMQEQILSRTRLQPLIERFDLFPKEMGKVPMEDLIDKMRKQILVTEIQADFATRTGGLPGFYISFTARDPHLAQQVCSEITSMFMQENLRAREQSAQGTTDFLAAQLDAAKRDLDDQDAKLAAFKQKYIGQLPEQEQANLSLLGALNTQLDSVNQALARAQEDKAFAQSLLSERLAALQTSPVGEEDPNNLQKNLADFEQQLSILQGRYTDDYPEVIKVKNQIAELKKQLEKKPPAQPVKDPDQSAQLEPPEIHQLRIQIHQLDDVQREKMKEQEKLQQEVPAYQSRVRMSPRVEEQYKALTRDHQTALNFYNDLLSKKTQSAMATDLEKKQEGEQFRVMDPPDLPEKPTSPNRLKFTLVGLAGGLCMGVGLALVFEMKDEALRNEEDVLFYLKLPVLMSLPTISHNNNGHNGKRERSTGIAGDKKEKLTA